MSLYRCTKGLNALANNAFTQLDKAVVKLQLVGLFIDGLYHDFLCMKVNEGHERNPKTF